MAHFEQDDLTWSEGDMPYSRRFGDYFYSQSDGQAECRHVFLGGNGLPDRWNMSGDFTIGELGFGTGLNFLETWRNWRESRSAGSLSFVSFEAFPMAPEDMIRAQAAFPEVTDLVTELGPFWGAEEITLPDLHLTIVTGDARVTLPKWSGKADAWFLDGFAPAKNPELWDPALMQAVHDHTAAGGTAATYTAAGHVRRALAEAGFAVTRLPGYGRKRHMTKAIRP